MVDEREREPGSLASELGTFVSELESMQARALDDLATRWPEPYPAAPVEAQQLFAAEAVAREAVGRAIEHLREFVEGLAV